MPISHQSEHGRRFAQFMGVAITGGCVGFVLFSMLAFALGRERATEITNGCLGAVSGAALSAFALLCFNRLTEARRTQSVAVRLIIGVCIMALSLYLLWLSFLAIDFFFVASH